MGNEFVLKKLYFTLYKDFYNDLLKFNMQVPVRDLESFLLTYSTKGYTILGVEQANESTSLVDFTFPKKSVLLLG